MAFDYNPFIIIFLLQKAPWRVGADDVLPKIHFPLIGETWQNISIPTTASHVFYSPDQGDDLFVRCEAPYPIQWNFTGVIAPPEILVFLAPKRNLIAKTYTIGINLFFEDAQNFTDLGSSLHVACEMVGNPDIKNDFFIFVLGKISNLPLIKPEIITVEDSTLIPCLTKNPTETTKLYQESANRVKKRIPETEVTYHPTQGFQSNKEFNGVFICMQGSSSVTFTALSTNYSDNYQFTPLQEGIRVFTEQTIQLECFSKSGGSVRLIVDDSMSNATTLYIPTDNGMIAQVSAPRTTAGSSDSITSVKGRAVCVTQPDEKLVKEWSFEFVETPGLYLDNYAKEAHCLSRVSPKTIQTVNCKNGMECSFMKNCLDNATRCNFETQKQFSGTSDKNCWLYKFKQGRFCTSLRYSHLNGVAQCKVNGLVKQWEFFISLEFLKYSDWKLVPERELLRMDEVSSILYTNTTTQFFCMAVEYLFADSISFEIELRNGSRFILEDNGSTVNISNPGPENPRKIDEFNVIGVLDIMLPIDTVGMHCLVPWWNTTEEMKISRHFETRHLLEPQLKELFRDSFKHETFYTKEKNRRLACFAKGEPQPEYTWYFQGNNVSQVFPELKTSLDSNGEGYLEFPLIDEDSIKYAGEYRCLAQNMVGSVERRFKLDIKDQPPSGTAVIYVTTLITILIVLACVLAMLYVFVRRYNVAKELVRNLTDNEIHDFFQGKPELLANAEIEPNISIVDFMPYKNDYEIPIEDLKFDSSDKNLLGSGNFSYVVRATIISKAQPVALKISKPSADVTLFKSLLSEVKIMIYIGEHENVVPMIGVCTQNIRNRSIYIATQICELGSLDKLLRKSRPSFVNLVNANQQIDMNLLPENFSPPPDQITTLNLIDFCRQIARGMEYLSHKSIIHADLAARNVLLTTDKVAKISDFGLSKKLYECNNYVKKSESPLPWRWMALESLTTLTFSTSSDIWAFGATLFEIFTLGDIPFPNEEWNREFLARLASGMRMGRPKHSTLEIYAQIIACWENEPEQRPSFTTLRVFFEKLLKEYEWASTGGGTGEISSNLLGPFATTTDSYYDNVSIHSQSQNQYTNIRNDYNNGDDNNVEGDKEYISESADMQQSETLAEPMTTPTYVNVLHKV